MFCVDHCVYVLLGTPILCFGGWGIVGQTKWHFDTTRQPLFYIALMSY
jgi:hypothetical protein